MDVLLQGLLDLTTGVTVGHIAIDNTLSIILRMIGRTASSIIFG
jgi:hypothetical protein